MSLDKVIEDVYRDNPNLTEKEAVDKLKKMEDPDTKKGWKAATIRNKVRLFNLKEDENKVRVEAMGGGGTADGTKTENKTPVTDVDGPVELVKINEGEFTKVDPFKKTDDAKQTSKADDDLSSFKAEIHKEINNLKMDVVDVFKVFKTEMVNVVGDLRKDMDSLHQGIKDVGSFEPMIEYADVSLKKTTVDAIEKELDPDTGDISVYVDDIRKKYKESQDTLSKLRDAVNNGLVISVDGEQFLMGKAEKKRFDKKSIGIGVGIGAGVVTVIYIVLHFLVFSVPATGAV